MSIDDAFDPRSNSVGFLRWALAFLVIFSHAGPVAGFYGGHDLGTQISDEQSLGGVAVAGFFFISGFLITRSRMGKSTVFRYFWRRILRIFPAFWAALLATAFVLAPLAWRKERGTFAGYFSVDVESPLTYFPNNMLLALQQRNIAGLGAELPYAQLHNSYDWNGSAWTLAYEFKGYILIGLLGLFGFLAYRALAATAAALILLANTVLWSGSGDISAFSGKLTDIFTVMLLAPFAFGILFALYSDRIKIDDRIAVAAFGSAILTYGTGGWNMWGQFAFCYFLMWCAVRLPLRNWERFGDLSYGIYIFAWPLMTLAASYGLQSYGWFAYHLVIVLAVHVLAFASWHLIEAPAMSLKNWTPRPLSRLITRLEPFNARLKAAIVDVRFSSTHYAHALAGESEDDTPLVTEDPSERVHSAGPHGQSSDTDLQPTSSTRR